MGQKSLFYVLRVHKTDYLLLVSCSGEIRDRWIRLPTLRARVAQILTTASQGCLRAAGGAPVARMAGPGRIRADLAGVDPFPADLAWRRPDPARLRAGGAMALLEVPVQREREKEVRGDREEGGEGRGGGAAGAPAVRRNGGVGSPARRLAGARGARAGWSCGRQSGLVRAGFPGLFL